MASSVSTDILKSKYHFEILDGLRGVAAISVVIFHFMEFVVPDYEKSFISHSYLAVDFFFCLSGFVIAYAYDIRLKEMGILNFVKLRLIRLHPLVIIGSIIGIVCFVFDPFADLYTKYGIKQAIIMFITSCLMIPYPKVPERYYNLFHLNPPSWSLMWEYVANLLYAFILVKINNKVLWVLVIIAAAILCHESYTAHVLSNGWGMNNILGGGKRVLFSFLAGMLVYRTNFIIRTKLGFIPLALLTFAAFVVPYRNNWTWLTDPITVILYFPVLVGLGAGAQLTDTFKKICKFSGEISYPLYMVHYPFLWVFYSYILKYKPTLSQMVMMIPIGVVLLLTFAYLVLTYVDTPIRKYLKRKLSKDLA